MAVNPAFPRSVLRVTLAVALLVTAAYAFRGRLLGLVFGPSEPPRSQAALETNDVARQLLSVVAEGLEAPWEIAFLPHGELLVTERPGRLVRIRPGEPAAQRRVYPVEGVRAVGEGGLMGLALHPRFEENRWIYLCLTTGAPGGGLQNRVVRYRLGDGDLGEPTVIVDGIPGARFHDGCRLAFGADSYLYVTTGDATDPARAQDTISLAGKILRVTDDGRPAPGNPFGNPVYSYGHRNPQGLAWDDRGRLWSTEHGRSGMRSGLDELNLIEKGKNYGWPAIEGDEAQPGMVPPVLHSGPHYTWAPAGMAYWSGSLFFGGLRGEALYEARIAGEGTGENQALAGQSAQPARPGAQPKPGPPRRGGTPAGPGARAAGSEAQRVRVELRVHFHGDYGRIRAVQIGPDGFLYFATSNRDGRGRPRDGDDRIVRVNPRVFRAP